MNSLKDLTPEEINLLPSEDEIRVYEERGWHVTPEIIPESLLDQALEGAEEFYRGEVDYKDTRIQGPANDSFSDDKVLMNNEYASLQKKQIKDLVLYPMVSAIAARLSRTSEIRLFADALMCKFPAKADNNGAFGWHTDKAYWPSCTSNDMLTAWIPLQDTTVDMGPMYVIENSHKWSMDRELQEFCAHANQNLTELEEYLAKSDKQYRSIPMALKKGQVSFHNGNVFHGSPANTSDKKRVTLTIHMQDQKNNYRPAYKENGEKIIIGYERMCGRDQNGDPDYRDPKFFPVLWSE